MTVTARFKCSCVGWCRYQDVEKVGAITKNIRLHLETNLGVDQRLPLGTCLTVSSQLTQMSLTAAGLMHLIPLPPP